MQTTNKQESLLGRYKNIFTRCKNLLASPKQEWIFIYGEKTDRNTILGSFNLPFIAIISLVTFIGFLTNHQDLSFEIALKHALSQFSAFFFGLFICYFITLKIMPQFVQKTNDKNINILVFKLIAYSSTLLYLVEISTALIPQIYYLQIITIYVAYVVWTGTEGIGKFETKDLRIVFTVIVTILLIFIPYMIAYFFIQFSRI